jgi:hypothetical protein
LNRLADNKQFGKYAGTEIKPEDEELQVMHETRINDELPVDLEKQRNNPSGSVSNVTHPSGWAMN